jgi:sec-independent protein translocase protein TatA
MGGLSWWHWLIILGAFVLLFGAKKLPDAARGVGRSLRILKSEVSAMSDDDSKTKDANGETVPPVAAVTPVATVPAPAIATTPTVIVTDRAAPEVPVAAGRTS